MRTLVLLLLLNLGFSGFLLAGQHTLAPEDVFRQADCIARVRLSASEVKVNSSDGLIYTYYTLEYFNLFSGIKSDFPLLIRGGVYGNRMQRSSAEYYPQTGEMILLAARLTEDFEGKPVFRPLSASAGIFSEGSYVNGEALLLNELISEHDALLSRLGFSNQNLQALPSMASQKSLVFIRTMSPLKIHAGHEEILTIEGFGFGTFFAPGRLKFRDANKAGVQYFDCPSQSVLSWTDNMVRVKVPAGAGSGQVIIFNGINSGISSASLSIDWGLLNTGNPETVFIPNAIKRNENGGYEFRIQGRFKQSTLYYEAFQRALTTWRCQTLVNFSVSNETDIAGTANDEYNIVSWDDKAQLDPGVIGLCYAYYSSCEQGKWYLDEIDLLFREVLNWHADEEAPSNQEYDFETVVLHELGHAQQLSHVVNSDDLMYYSLAKGESKRQPAEFNRTAIAAWFSHSESWNSCNYATMRRIPASVCNDLSFGFYDPAVYPNPFSGNLFIDFFLTDAGNISLQIFDLRGRMVFEFQDYGNQAGKSSMIIDVESMSLRAGLYLLKLDAPGYSETIKLIKN